MSSTHDLDIIDGDSYFVIDPVTRAISNEDFSEYSLMQYDHNSERFTFKLVRYIDGHDMLECKEPNGKVRIHYVNTSSSDQTKHVGLYEVADLAIDPETAENKKEDQSVIFSWLISKNATMVSGSLSFMISFTCVEEEFITYRWNTKICNMVSVSQAMNNSSEIMKENADILESWWQKLIDANGGFIDANKNEKIKIWVGTQAEYNKLSEITEDCIYMITDNPVVESLMSDIDRHEIEINNVKDGTTVVGAASNYNSESGTIKDKFDLVDNEIINIKSGATIVSTAKDAQDYIEGGTIKNKFNAIDAKIETIENGTVRVKYAEESNKACEAVNYTDSGTIKDKFDSVDNEISKIKNGEVIAGAASNYNSESGTIKDKFDLIDNGYAGIRTKIGTGELETGSKNIVGAINEVAINIGDITSDTGKTSVRSAITSNNYNETRGTIKDKFNAIDSEMNLKQCKTDDGLVTNSKTIVGAINEVSYKTPASRYMLLDMIYPVGYKMMTTEYSVDYDVNEIISCFTWDKLYHDVGGEIYTTFYEWTRVDGVNCSFSLNGEEYLVKPSTLQYTATDKTHPWMIPAIHEGFPVSSLAPKNVGGATASGEVLIDKVKIPDTVSKINPYAFKWFEKLTEVTIPNSVFEIGDDAFRCCKALTNITLPQYLRTLGDYAFESCISLTNIEIRGNISIINEGTFMNCSVLTEIILPSSIRKVSASAFENCSALVNATIPSTVISIGEAAFRGCSSLTEIEIPEGVSSIAKETFRYCTSLESVAIPSTVTSIGEGAFRGCSSLTNIYYGGTKEEWISITKGSLYYAGCSGDLLVYSEKDKVYFSPDVTS